MVSLLEIISVSMVSVDLISFPFKSNWFFFDFILPRSPLHVHNLLRLQTCVLLVDEIKVYYFYVFLFEVL